MLCYQGLYVRTWPNLYPWEMKSWLLGVYFPCTFDSHGIFKYKCYKVLSFKKRASVSRLLSKWISISWFLLNETSKFRTLVMFQSSQTEFYRRFGLRTRSITWKWPVKALYLVVSAFKYRIELDTCTWCMTNMITCHMRELLGQVCTLSH